MSEDGGSSRGVAASTEVSYPGYAAMNKEPHSAPNDPDKRSHKQVPYRVPHKESLYEEPRDPNAATHDSTRQKCQPDIGVKTVSTESRCAFCSISEPGPGGSYGFRFVIGQAMPVSISESQNTVD